MLKLNVVKEFDECHISKNPCSNVNEEVEYRIDEIPKGSEWTFIPLYKINLDGQFTSWQIKCNDRKLEELIDTEVTNVLHLNFNDDPIKIAREKYKQKRLEGYSPPGPMQLSVIQPMKAGDYKHGAIKNWPVLVQAKINGIRMLCQNKEGSHEIFMRSSLHNIFSNLEHLEKELKDLLLYLPKYTTLDGELYNHHCSLANLRSIIKTTKTIHPQISEIEYWIFDLNYEDSQGGPLPSFDQRYQILTNAFARYVEDNGIPSKIKLVPCQSINNVSQIQSIHDQYIDQGYEGLMIRKISLEQDFSTKQYTETTYKSGRSNHILKYKDFKDEETTIIDCEIKVESELNPNKQIIYFTVKTVNGNIWKCSSILEEQYLAPFHIEFPQTLIGKQLTIRYNKIDDKGHPINSKIMAIRDYE